MNDPTPVPTQQVEPPDRTLGELLNHVVADERGREHNRAIVARAMARSSIEAFSVGAQVAALEACDPYTQFPAVARLRAFANNEFGLDLTPEAVRRIRGRVCEALDIDTTAADALPLARVVEVLRRPQEDLADASVDQFRWLRVRQIGRLFDLNPGVVTKLADDGIFVTNGQSGYDRCIDVLSVIRRELDRLDRPESANPETGG